MAHLQQDINVIDVFKKVYELTHMMVLKTPVNLDFRHKLLLCSTLSQACLLDKFASMHHLGLLTQKFIALSEAAFSQKFSLLVSSDAGLSIRQFYGFLDHGHCVIRSVHF